MWFRGGQLFRFSFVLFCMVRWPLRRVWRYEPTRIIAFILVRDIYSPLESLVRHFLSQGVPLKNIHLIDTGTTQPACLATLHELKERGCQLIEVPVSERCFGPYVPWLSRAVSAHRYASGYPFVVTDPDLMLPDAMPSDWLKRLFEALQCAPGATKAGLPLWLEDVDVSDGQAIKTHERALAIRPLYKRLSRLLLPRLPGLCYCPTDTTLALYRPGEIFSTFGVRIHPDYAIKHLPWYQWFRDTEEFHYYSTHKDQRFGQWSGTVGKG